MSSAPKVPKSSRRVPLPYTLLACLAAVAAGPAASAAAAAGLPSKYRVEYDDTFHTPRYLANRDARASARRGAPARFTDEQAFQIVRRFVVRYAAAFRLRPGIDDFRVTRAHGSDGANLVKVQQTYRGLPVDGGGYGTSVLPNGEVGSMIGRFMPGLEVATEPRVSVAEARGKAIPALAPRPVQVAGEPELEISTRGGVPRLTWAVVVKSPRSFGTWTVLVDARNGSVLAVLENFVRD